MSDLVRVRVQLPFADSTQFATYGPRWTDLWIREGSSDEDVLREVWINDVYQVRGLDKHGWQPDLRNGPQHTLGKCIIDIGACTGIFSALCLAYGAAHVIAVEPEPANVELLARNLGNGPRVTIIDSAVGDGHKVGFTGDTGTGHTGPLIEDFMLTVESRTLERIISLAHQPVALLKCDIEGGEYDAFLACPSDALKRVERVALEWHGPSECPWLDSARIGELVQHLQHTHSCSVIGKPDAGGYLFAHRNDL